MAKDLYVAISCTSIEDRDELSARLIAEGRQVVCGDVTGPTVGELAHAALLAFTNLPVLLRCELPEGHQFF